MKNIFRVRNYVQFFKGHCGDYFVFCRDFMILVKHRLWFCKNAHFMISAVFLNKMSRFYNKNQNYKLNNLQSNRDKMYNIKNLNGNLLCQKKVK